MFLSRVKRYFFNSILLSPFKTSTEESFSKKAPQENCLGNIFTYSLFFLTPNPSQIV